MSRAHDGGPAFPTVKREPGPAGAASSTDKPGMSLRDYFAAQALLTRCSVLAPADAARSAYEYADAMLKERIK